MRGLVQKVNKQEIMWTKNASSLTDSIKQVLHLLSPFSLLSQSRQIYIVVRHITYYPFRFWIAYEKKK